MKAERALSVDDLAREARRLLPPSIYGYVSGGSEDQSSVRGNRKAFERWRFLPRPLVDVSQRSQAVVVLGTTYASPVGISPMGVAGLCHYDGNMVLARAAADANVPFVLSAALTVPLEWIDKSAPGTWYQAYLPARDEIIGPLLDRLRAADIGVLVVTVDVPIAAARENELRNGFSVPLRLTPKPVAGGLARPRWMLQTFARTLIRQGIPHFENFTATRGGPIIVTAEKGDHRAGRAAMMWNEIRRIRDRWRGKLLVNGILRAPHRASGRRRRHRRVESRRPPVGRRAAPLDALPSVVAAVPDMTVLMDGRHSSRHRRAQGAGPGRALCLHRTPGDVWPGRWPPIGRRLRVVAAATRDRCRPGAARCADVRQFGPDFLLRDDLRPN